MLPAGRERPPAFIQPRQQALSARRELLAVLTSHPMAGF